MSISFLDAFFIIFVSSASLYAFRKFARAVGLVDKPTERKQHSGSIPLVGGVAICFTVVHYLYFNPYFLEANNLYIFSIIALTIVGALDDKFDVSFKIRLLVQSLISLIMINQSGIMLSSLGNLLGFGDVELGYWGVPVTLLAVVGAINAFNMVDGIDGLLGGISLVTFGAFAFLMYWSGQYNKLYICMLFILAIVPFILMNLGALGKKRKVFMGDAGSMMLGFTIVWLLLSASQSSSSVNTVRPVSCLWLIALPLFDMCSIILRRIQRGASPFKPDREHLHHVLHDFGIKQNKTLLIICFLSAVFATIGVVGEVYYFPEIVMFLGFLLSFLIFHLALKKAAGRKLNSNVS